MEPNDNELILRAQRGEVVAFEQLVHRYDRNVLAIASRYTRNAEDAQDIYQEVFLRVYRGLAGFKFKSLFSTWLYRVVTNVCLSFKKKNSRVEQVSLDGMYENRETLQLVGGNSSRETPEKLFQYVEFTDRVNLALESLSRQQRLVFILKHYEERKLSEIATMMNCAEGTVKRYLFLATKKLRSQLRPAAG